MDGRHKHRVLIAGGGVAALEAALALRELAADHVAVELLAPDPHFWYRPLSVREPFGLGPVTHFEIDALAHSIGAERTPAGLTGIDAWHGVAHTTTNVEVPYDTLLVACGALPLPGIAGAITFRGSADSEKVEHLLEEIVSGEVSSVAFAIPWGAVWSLPAYELALLTAAHLRSHGVRGVEITLVTPEAEPLQVFGPPASEAIGDLFAAQGIDFRGGTYARGFSKGVLDVLPGPELTADRVVALPRLEGAPIDGIPQTVSGFVPVDSHCQVHGVESIYAAGDITSFPVKQGGIAAQQADAAAEAIAAAAGVKLAPRPFRPVLRGLLLTGRQPQYLRRELALGPEHEPLVDYEALWWPPAKIVGHYLAPFLAKVAGVEGPVEFPESAPDALSVEVELATPGVEATSGALALDPGAPHDEHRVEEVMARDVVVVGPDDTLGVVAGRMTQEAVNAAVVAEHGNVIGILTTSDAIRASAARVQAGEAVARLWMTAEPVVVSPGWAVSAAALLMSEYGIHHLPVVEEGRVVGMLESEDLGRAAVPVGAVVRSAFDA